MSKHGTCTACHLPTNVPEHLPPPDAAGVCAACSALRNPGMVERIATNAMPACFTPTRESYVRMAAYMMLVRAALRVTARQLEIVAGADPRRQAETLELVKEARALAGEVPRG